MKTFAVCWPEALWSFSAAAPQDSVHSRASCSNCWSPPLSCTRRQYAVCLKLDRFARQRICV